MERLTKHDGRFISVTGCKTLYENEERKSAPASSAIVRLAAYEDTGLTPQEIIALQNKQAENKLLTLDELREMPLLEWLWIELIHPSDRQKFQKVKSAYYQIFEDYTDGDALCCGWTGLIHDFEYENYGKTWLAYRRKPEEGAK